MMPDYLTPQARAVAMRAYEHARRLGHRYLGGEHFLLALASCGEPAGAVLREHGVTPERVEEQVVRGAGDSLFGDLDRGALAAIGVDVDAVRARVEAGLGPQSLTRAAQAARRTPRLARLNPRPVSGAVRDGVFLPHAPDVQQAFRTATQEAQARRDARIGTGHLALGLLAVTEGSVPAIVSALGVSAPALRAAILGRYRQAS
jgi:ATP-dependent Clp protease ATP-binding subunit ClpA